MPVLADLCIIDIADEAGPLRRMAAWHADPQKRALTRELRARTRPNPTVRTPRSRSCAAVGRCGATT